MNNDEVIKKLQIKNGKLQVQIERLKLDKEEYYLDYLDLQQRIDKAIDILDNSSHYLKICVDNDLTPMQLASKILRGEE